MNLQNLLTNWKTTSAGLVMIVGSVVHLVFAIKSGKADEGAYTTAATGILAGLGLLFAGDASATTQAHTETLNELANIKSAVRTGDTSILTKPQPATTVKPT